jgi:hypothetical protein
MGLRVRFLARHLRSSLGNIEENRGDGDVKSHPNKLKLNYNNIKSVPALTANNIALKLTKPRYIERLETVFFILLRSPGIESASLCNRSPNCKTFKEPGIDSKESIPPAM